MPEKIVANVTLKLNTGIKEISKEFNSINASSEWIAFMAKNPRFISGSSKYFALISGSTPCSKEQYDKIYTLCFNRIIEMVKNA